MSINVTYNEINLFKIITVFYNVKEIIKYHVNFIKIIIHLKL